MPSREQRVRVWRGELKKTTGGLTKDDLVKNRKGKIVSRRKSRQAADQNNLGEWLRNKGDRFQDMPQAHAAKGLKAIKPKPPKKAPEPKPKRVPPALPKKKKKKYEDDEDWAPPKQPAKAAPKGLKGSARRDRGGEAPQALIPRPPKPLPKPKPAPKPRGPGRSKIPGHPAKQVLKAKVPKPRGPGRASLPGRPAKQPKPKQKKKKVVLHAREPQPEFVKFKEDLGKSSLKVAKEPDLYAVRRDPIVESAPVARNVNPKFSDVSVSNIRRRSSRRKKKRVDYSKFF